VADNSITPTSVSSGPGKPNSVEKPIVPAQSKSTSVDTSAVPDEVRKQFMQVKNRYYFRDGAHAFTDRGQRLVTQSENRELIKNLVAIAQSRNWTRLTLRGSERFREEAWVAASEAGLAADGFSPRNARQSVARKSAGTKEAGSRPAEDFAASALFGNEARFITGTLVDHGPDSYQHRPGKPASYFLKLATAQGERTLWGVDLERAVKQSQSGVKIGDELGILSVRKDPVTVKTGDRALQTHRNRWVVEKRAFFEARAEAAHTVRDTTVDPKRAVQRHPELVGTYLQLHAAELAAKRFGDPRDRLIFVQKVREALAQSLARGDRLPSVRLKERVPERSRDDPEGPAARTH